MIQLVTHVHAHSQKKKGKHNLHNSKYYFREKLTQVSYESPTRTS